uniref:Uncharacterized protein n=1 Tax=Stomoxys calcitrans TaxID=35570 RepID=A0A1I8P297_STOCA
MSKQLKGLIYLLLYGTSFVRAITIRDELTTTTVSSSGNPVETSTYRITQPKAKNPSHRVPEYLQRVRNGFVYEDADDVIRVIEPPKHFEQLKMLMQSRQNIPAPEIRERGTVKTKPTRPLTKAKPKKSLRPQRTTTKKPVENDLEIQETEQLPVEILASVRKTENYLRKFKPKLPLAPLQRVKTKKIHTVIWEKAQEQQQYVQGQEKKVGGIRHFAESKQRRKFLKKRIKRAAASPQPLKGEDLLEHIDELALLQIHLK